MYSFLQKNISYLEGVGSQRSKFLAKELGIQTYGDLLRYFPFRYEDRTQWHEIKVIRKGMPYVQCKGTLTHMGLSLQGQRKVLRGTLQDPTGTIQLIWFHGLEWLQQKMLVGHTYALLGKPVSYHYKLSLIHPEIVEPHKPDATAPTLQPIYHSTTRLTIQGLHSKGIAKLQKNLLVQCRNNIAEIIPPAYCTKYHLLSRAEAFSQIHFPGNQHMLARAKYRFAFEEIFLFQLRAYRSGVWSKKQQDTFAFTSTNLFKEFLPQLPFVLTKSQKKVLKEIYKDLGSGKQMNRLLQGDVGSGKTMVAFLSMLFPVAHKAQVAFMAPTTLLANQHYDVITHYSQKLRLHVALLTGSTTSKQRKQICDGLRKGEIDILIGTHALIQDNVVFNQLGLVIIDEQHRFGVVQRARLSQPNSPQPPHILVLTATPIPRTLAMTLYRHLNLSALDELPPNRKPVKTYHIYDSHRLRLFGFLKQQLAQGYQAYIVYPYIQSAKDPEKKDLFDGYESICRALPGTPVSILHSQMKEQDKTYEMTRFVRGETKIMLATTVVEVGVDVPNATLMIIENAENFGLAQLHQLRGRVARSNTQAYCVLVTKAGLTAKAKKRIHTLVTTHDGFAIADADLRLRGPGTLDGLAQSGLESLRFIDFSQDHHVMQDAIQAVTHLLHRDSELTQPAHAVLHQYLAWLDQTKPSWLQVA